MKLNSDQYSDLFNRLMEDKLSPEETQALIEWLGKNEVDPVAAELIYQQLQKNSELESVDPAVIASLENRLPAILRQRKKGSVIFMGGNKWLRYAAMLLITLSIAFAGVYFLNADNDKGVNAAVSPALIENDIQPGMEGAVLTLSDGRTIVLDSLGNGVIATQNGAQVILKNGVLVYNSEVAVPGAMAYNTISTANGRQFHLTLADGTKVWLNAGSSLRYPIAFAGGERRVEVTGEGYFEVTTDKAKPFIVEINNETEIEVLGTQFNVNSYVNEASIKTTLLEGSVKIKNASGGNRSEVVIVPGQQANLEAGKFTIAKQVNISKVMAWKNGLFDFQDASLEEVMRQLERWYDIDVVYEKGIPKIEFVGKMGRDLSLVKVLRGLEMSEVRFRLEGRKLVVMP